MGDPPPRHNLLKRMLLKPRLIYSLHRAAYSKALKTFRYGCRLAWGQRDMRGLRRQTQQLQRFAGKMQADRAATVRIDDGKLFGFSQYNEQAIDCTRDKCFVCRHL